MVAAPARETVDFSVHFRHVCVPSLSWQIIIVFWIYENVVVSFFCVLTTGLAQEHEQSKPGGINGTSVISSDERFSYMLVPSLSW